MYSTITRQLIAVKKVGLVFNLIFLFRNTSDCEPDKRNWNCRKCKNMIWFDISHQVLVCTKCEVTVKSLLFVPLFKCKSHHHGLQYVPYQKMEHFQEQVDRLMPVNCYNILILGETGVGKSTWINGIFNYMHFENLKDAIKNDPIIMLPSTFNYVSDDGEHEIKVGEDSDECEQANSEGHSVTKRPRTFELWYEENNCLIHLIDTPGVGDPRGDDVDRNNFDKILTHLMSYDQLHAICILLKPNNSRLTPMFRYCIKELFTHLHKVSKMFISLHIIP